MNLQTSAHVNNWSDQSKQSECCSTDMSREIDSTWNFQTGVQFGIDNREERL
ncbi:MAG: hypothetical protein R2879_19450 [Saprospiraceae bacterium]